MSRVRIALAGVGSCASALVQGIEYYRHRDPAEHAGLMHARIAGLAPADVRRKVEENDLPNGVAVIGQSAAADFCLKT